jgi:carbamoyltransferase
MTAILGVSALYHDAAAALVMDGRVHVAIQEERLSRIKNDPSVPVRAMRACLREAGLAAGDLDEVVFYENPYRKLERALISSLQGFPRTLGHFHSAMASQLGGKVWVLDAIAEALGIPRRKVTHVEHHASHAASAFFTSGLARAAVLTIDGVGEEASTALWLGEGDELRCLSEQRYPHSLGLFYAAFTAYCGFRVNEGEQKLMGLAAFGEPRFRDEIAAILRVSGDGAIDLDLDCFDAFRDADLGFGPRLEALLGPRRTPGAPWHLDDPEDRRFADVARSVQEATEDALLALARRAREEAPALCLAGGVALNAVANARIAAEAGFDHVYVHPAAGDAGGALGAALLRSNDRVMAPLKTAALGVRASPEEALEISRELGLEAERVSDPAEFVAERLAAGEVVGLVAGRSEWGPRALGQRSLLAPAGPESVRRRLHRAVKEREPFRPFAPAALASRAAEMFDQIHLPMTRFMTTIARARAPDDPELAAVVHVDGSARLQTVDEESAPELHRVLAALERQSGRRAVLNTSLNASHEPMCLSAMDAIAFLLQHPVDAMVIEDVAVRRKAGGRR